MRAIWIVLVLSAAANAVTSTAGGPAPLAVGFGVITVACVVALVVNRMKRRKA